jgi:hypothetical protein
VSSSCILFDDDELISWTGGYLGSIQGCIAGFEQNLSSAWFSLLLSLSLFLLTWISCSSRDDSDDSSFIVCIITIIVILTISFLPVSTLLISESTFFNPPCDVLHTDVSHRVVLYGCTYSSFHSSLLQSLDGCPSLASGSQCSSN